MIFTRLKILNPYKTSIKYDFISFFFNYKLWICDVSVIRTTYDESCRAFVHEIKTLSTFLSEKSRDTRTFQFNFFK